ncbi:LysE family translocator [Actimicrobium antarcticum]|uniref:LysE family translocator n=1 Tax=Actimicrobium antarcticum TaxID=1051899 RepID=A0ABP7T5D3_9BURK
MSIPGITDFGYFCVAVLLLNATPGPDTAFIVGRSIAQGRAAGLVSALGISAGCCVHALASAFGLSALLATSADAFMVVKLAGGMYLMYLGIRMLFARSVTTGMATGAAVRQTRPLMTIFWQALMTNVLNPKVILFFLSFFPQFVQPNAAHRTWSFLLLGTVFVLMSTGWNCTTAIVAGTLARRTASSQRAKLWLERCVGTAFIALGARIAFTRN